MMYDKQIPVPGQAAQSGLLPASPGPIMPALPPTAEDRETPRPGGRVLLVEDDLVNIEIAKAVLEPSGFAVSVAMTGREAVVATVSHRFDLILMDIQLPDIDGFETTRRIRAGEAPGRRTPIVAMTGSVGAHIPQRCIDAGMDGHEAKPLTGELLARLAARWLPGHMSAPRQPASSLSPARLAALFRESAARLVADLRRAHAGADRVAVMRAAHTLKSISARVPATQLSARCEQLEAVAGNPQVADLGPAVAALLDTYADLDPALLGEPASAPALAPATKPAALPAPLVLVVDDEENERFLVRHTLKQAGYRVDECDCGQTAIDYCRNRCPDAVLLDGLMPGMDGIATCKALRADFPADVLPILMYSGLNDPAWRELALQAGANGFIDKSVGMNELAANLRAGLIAFGFAARG
jgi:CheY-like chemotaxis protein